MSATAETTTAGLPIYQRIARILRSRIFHSLYLPGSSIPSENELAREFGVARLTVRQAIQELRREGALIARRGSGTFVPPGFRMVRPVHFVGYLEDLVLQSLTLVTELKGIRPVDATAEVRDAYRLAKGAKVIRFDRLRYTDGKPAQYSINYLLPQIARKLSLEKLGPGSLSEMLSREAGIEITSATQRITAVAANRETSRMLGVAVGAPLLFSQTLGFEVLRPVNFAHVYYRPEHVFFTAELTSLSSDLRATTARAAAAGSGSARTIRPQSARVAVAE
jgi:GntR family transcriptional regulator